MKIIIKKEVEDYLIKKGKNTISVELVRCKAGWAGQVLVADIKLSEPLATDNFNVFEVSNMKVFVSKNIEPKNDTILFALRKILFWNEVYAMRIDLKI